MVTKVLQSPGFDPNHAPLPVCPSRTMVTHASPRGLEMKRGSCDSLPVTHRGNLHILLLGTVDYPADPDCRLCSADGCTHDCNLMCPSLAISNKSPSRAVLFMLFLRDCVAWMDWGPTFTQLIFLALLAITCCLLKQNTRTREKANAGYWKTLIKKGFPIKLTDPGSIPRGGLTAENLI